MRDLVGNLLAQGHTYALVVARFNRPITQLLLEGALEGLERHGVEKSHITVVWVPGAFELPLVAQRLAKTKKYDAVICIGAVIKGETPHFDYVAGQAASGILHATLHTEIPVIFSVLTTNTKDQAERRAGNVGMNAGFSGALTAIEMVNVLKQIG